MLQFNFFQCYLEGSVPSHWQNSAIVEVFKSGDFGDPGRFRPITLIAAVYKIYQQMLYYNHLRSRLLAGPRQHGFQPKKSCTTQLHQVLTTMESITRIFAELHGLAMDLSQAFDCLIYLII